VNGSSNHCAKSSNQSTTPAKANSTSKGLGGRTITGVCTRIAQRILALTAAIWHNDHLGLTIRRSLTTYDH
jgi:hypothetical protein